VDDGSSRIDPSGRRPLLHGALTHEVIGAFFEVYNDLRWGLLESVYGGALEIEFQDRRIAYLREAKLDVRYKGRAAGFFRADFLIENRVVLELKASVAIGDPDRRQLLNYLRLTGMSLGLLLHFGPEPRVVRVING
jgi:GxxExxY protein